MDTVFNVSDGDGASASALIEKINSQVGDQPAQNDYELKDFTPDNCGGELH